MKRVTYYINDHEYMRRQWANLDNVDKILKGLPEPFVCVYTLTGQEGSRFYEHFSLTDIMGRPIKMSDLNSYQKGVVLVAAQRHYEGYDSDMFGIIDFKEEHI